MKRKNLKSKMNSIFHADHEVWGILHGLEMVWRQGIQQVIIESDYLIAINMLQKGCPRDHPCAALVRDIVRSLQRHSRVRFTHVLRAANAVADIFAKKGNMLPLGVHSFEVVPCCTSVALFADYMLMPQEY